MFCVLQPSNAFNKLFVCALLAAFAAFEMVQGIGMPSGGGGGGGGGQCCCSPCCGSGGGGGGGFGGFGRRKRSAAFDAAVQPVYRSVETPCPQSAWKPLIEKSILSAKDGHQGPAIALQSTLYSKYPEQKFFVACHADSKAKVSAAGAKGAIQEGGSMMKPVAAHFIAAGDAYCTAFAKNVWCHVVAMSA